MKKIYFLAAAVAAFLAVSCAKEKEKEAPAPQAPVEEVDDDTTPMPVLFGSQLSSVVETKAAVEHWDVNGRKLYILGYETGLGGSPIYMTYLDKDDDQAVDQFPYAFIENVIADAPYAQPAPANSARTPIVVYNPDVHTAQYDEPFYYTDGKYYNFWGYFIDNATTYPINAQEVIDWENAQGAAAVFPGMFYTGPQAPAVGDQATVSSVKLPLKITGTQDIMRAYTNKANDLENRSNFDKAIANTDKFYSAWSARRGVNPNLIFEHQLSRFVFQIKKGGTVESDKITIAGISLESFDKGILEIVGAPTSVPVWDWAPATPAVLYATVAEYNEANGTELTQDAFDALTDDEKIKTPAQDAQWVASTTKSQNLYLTVPEGATRVDLPLCDNQGNAITANNGIHPLGDYNPIGESIMAMPGQSLYHFTLELEQVGVTAGIAPQALDIDLTSLTGEGQKPYAEPGKQYVVKLIVYGVEDVKVTVSLTDWVEGGEVEIDPDADDADTRTPATVTITPNELESGPAGTAWQSADITIASDGGALSYTFTNVTDLDHPVAANGITVVPGNTEGTYAVTITNTVAAGSYKITVTSAATATKKAGSADITLTVPAQL